MRKFLSWAIILIIIAITVHFFYLRSKAPKESYPDDTWLKTAKNKTALIIVAHDDDAISCSGTIIKLCKAGWIVKELCFYNTVTDAKENERIRKRQQDTKKVKQTEGLASFEYVTLPYRDWQFSSSPGYMPASQAQFDRQYNKDTLLFYIRNFITSNNPSVIFTLDNNIGGYGHPDHKLIGQLVVDECMKRVKENYTSVEYIYQPVFTPSMVTKILSHLPVYKAALKTYGVGCPLPDVQVNISSVGSEKKKVMQAYSTEQNSIKQFWPSYQFYPAAIYFRLFDREFFKIIPVK
jgi:LmbE family N-acetylglucosaminyl deacetylase